MRVKDQILDENSSPFTLQSSFNLEHIKQSRKYFATFPNTLKLVKNSPLLVEFLTLFSVQSNLSKTATLGTGEGSRC